MNSKPLENLRINNPCPLLQSRLNKTTDGNFDCNSCCHKVFDFTKASDEEILKVLASGGKICGIFQEDQLKGQDKVRYNFWQKLAYRFLVAASFLGFTVSPLHVSAQLQPNEELHTELPTAKKDSKKGLDANGQKIPTNTDSIVPEAKTKKRRKRRKFRFFRKRRIMGCPTF